MNVGAGESLTVRGVLLTGEERCIGHSPWPALNRLNGVRVAALLFAMIAPTLILSYALDPDLGLVIASTAAMGLGLFLFVWASNWFWRRYVLETALTPTGAEADDWFIDASTIKTSSPALIIETSWKAMADVRETDKVFHFVLTPALILALPKRVLSDADADTIRRFAEDARARGELRGVMR
jgi:hypothetical protein